MSRALEMFIVEASGRHSAAPADPSDTEFRAGKFDTGYIALLRQSLNRR
jgi:hypothetical protein